MDPLAPKVAERFAAATKKLPTYTGVFLDESSHKALLSWWQEHTDTPLLSGKVHAHHMTLKFKPTAEEIESASVGKQIKLKVIGWAADDKAQAVLVQPEGISSANAHPHITISTAPGVNPSYSNELIAQGLNHTSGPTLHGVVDARF